MSGFLGMFTALVVTALLLTGVSRVGDAALDDVRAMTAADAAALAGAAAGAEAASEAAARNGGRLVSVAVHGSVTTAEVRVGSATAVAHAERLEVPE